jgi:hypothetical protein
MKKVNEKQNENKKISVNCSKNKFAGKLFSYTFGFLLLTFLLISSVSAEYTRTSNYNTLLGGIGSLAGGFFGETAGQFDRTMCEAGQDFVLQIAPAGCTPAVVRSDLLEEQNVPIYCQIAATQINPLIDVKAIDWITFSGQTPSEVAGVSFFPNNAALGTGRETTFGTYPVLDNIGYAVIVLKRQPNESAMPKYVTGNLTAKIRYNIQNAWGVGEAAYYLPLLTDEQFNERYNSYGFWDGRGFLKAENIELDKADISVYSGKTGYTGNRQKLQTLSLKEGATSDKIYMTGFNYCLANMRIRLDDINYPDTRAKIIVNADVHEVAEDEIFLEGKCEVKNIKKYGINEEVEIKCREDQDSGLFGVKTFTLKNSPRVKLEVNDKQGEYGLGDFVGMTDENNAVYIGYIGSVNNNNKLESLKLFFVTLTPEQTNQKKEANTLGKLDDDILETISTRLGPIYEKSTSKSDAIQLIGNFFSEYVLATAYRGIRNLLTGESVDGLFYTDGEQKIKGLKIKIKDFAGAVDKELAEESIEYYEKAIADYDEVLENFASETYDSIKIGDETLSKKIDLLKKMEQKRTLVELCKKFNEKYPSQSISQVCSDAVKLSSDSSSSTSVTINGKNRQISFDGVYEPSEKEYGVIGIIRDNVANKLYNFDLAKGNKLVINDSTGEYVELSEIKDENSADLILKLDSSKTLDKIGSAIFTGKQNLKLGVPLSPNQRYTITISKINIQRVAKVSVLPNIDYSGTETKFGFKIGIEKRNNLLKLSPDKARDEIKNLNDTIKKFEDISSTLGNVVTGLKTACLATGAWFTVENFLSNMDGKGIARHKVMRDAGGWYEQCDKLINSQKYETRRACLFDNADAIEADVNAYSKALSEQNKEIKGMQKIIKNGGLLSEDVVDSTGLIKDYSEKISDDLANCAGIQIANPLKAGETIKISEIKSALSFNVWSGSKNYNFEELRDIGFYCKVLNKNPDDERAKQRLYSLLYDLKKNSPEADVQDIANNLGISSSKIRYIPAKGAISYNYLGLTYNDIKSKIELLGIKDDNPIEIILQDGKKYILILDDSAGEGTLPIKKTDNDKFMIYDFSTNNLIESPPENLKGDIYFTRLTSTSYNNKYNNPEVKYYETEPYKGYPALVPIDTDNGWYAAITQTLPIGSNIRSYDASGVVRSYYLGNVGRNGNVDFFAGGGDDIYQMIVLDSKETYSRFSELSETEVANLVGKAAKAILRVHKQYSAGVQKVDIPGIGSVRVGSPSVDTSQVECEDFMSPNKCKILFNVCDPVICPSSRCNLGGAYAVSDVMQSGIIGSIALCLPNIKEGILMPVCLTGVKAGLDSWISIQKSYRDCLQEQLQTGKTIGICDEIQSIYMCELFWRQSLPVAKIVIPAVLGKILGQTARGGGEYLGVMNAWENAQKSIDYFTQYYADDSFRAFKARTTDEVGGELCNSFASAVYPSSGNILDSLTKPDSPPQFTGNFEEIPFTTTTNPPVSHYKVFYHIYAGTDSGAYFRVYLRGSSGSSYYQDTAISRIVGYGYIPKGESKTDTPDFIAPSGYLQLCIVVNGQEECGFKQVSSDFSLNYLKEQYLKEQATQQITSESECISGTPSLYSMLNPNLQEGAGNVINAELYKQGIYRICATNNPGNGTDSYIGTESQRWVDIGYCGTKNLRCWLDTNSVKNSIKNLNIERDTLDDINSQVQANLAGTQQSPDFRSTLEQIKNEKNYLSKIKIINEVIGKFFVNKYKGWLLMMRGDAYGRLASEFLHKQTKPEGEGDEITNTVQQITTEKQKIGLNYPIFEFKDRRLLTGQDLYMVYSGNTWYWNIKSNAPDAPWQIISIAVLAGTQTNQGQATGVEIIPKLNEENKKFLEGFYLNKASVSYIDGLISLMSRIVENKESGFFMNVKLSTERVQYSPDKIFTVSRSKATDIYFNYDFSGGKWRWSPDKTNWMNVPEVIVNSGRYKGKQPVEENVNLIKSLDEKNEYDGAAIIFGIDANQKLPLTDNSKDTEPSKDRKDVIYNFNPSITEQQMINYITSASAKSYVDRKCNCGANCITYAKLILEASKKYSIPDPVLLLSLMMQESSCNLNAGSGSSYGLMQINTWEYCKNQLHLVSINDVIGKGNVKNNIECGAIILGEKYKIYKNGVTFNGCTAKFKDLKYYKWEAALRGYNGLGCNKNYPEQDKFVPEIMTRFKCLKGEIQC